MAARNYSDNGYDGERYERYDFDATEDDHIVSEILINLEALIHQFNLANSHEPQPITCTTNSYEPEPTTLSIKSSSSYEPTWAIKATNLSEPLWNNKKKRSALDFPPSPPRVEYAPPRVEMKNEGKKDENLRIRDVKTGDQKDENTLVYSPSSPLNFEHNGEKNKYNHIQSKHQLKNKSNKRKMEDWEELVQQLEQTRHELKLGVDAVSRYLQTLLELNAKLKTKRDEKNGELKRKSLPLQLTGGYIPNFETGHHQVPKLPIFAAQQQQQQQPEYTHQQGGGGITFQHYPVSNFQANDKVLQAAAARHRRKIKISTKKISNSNGFRSSTS